VSTHEATAPRAWRLERSDVLVAALCALIDIGGSAAVAHRHGVPTRAWDAGAVLLLAIGPALMLVRRRVPVATLAATFSAVFVYEALGYPNGPHWAALTSAFFTAMLTGHRRAAQVSLFTGYVAFSWDKPLFHRGPGPSVIAAFGLSAWLIILLGAGEVFRIRSERAAEAERVREEAARRRASEERLRIAREVHDVVAHHMSLINVQASTALHVYDEHPERAQEALAAIKATSKQALVELRSVVGALRRVDEELPRSPTPGAAQLDDLVEQSRASGLRVAIATEGEARPLPQALDIAVYRIVQEALTNVARHAGAAEARVRVEYGPDDVVVEVDDDGRVQRGAPVHVPGGSASGIAGMRERTTLLGGTLQAAPRPDGGFRVRAWFPTEPDA
jgi:signal transduction histidine kinase